MTHPDGTPSERSRGASRAGGRLRHPAHKRKNKGVPVYLNVPRADGSAGQPSA